jgi:hypothetical protein
MDPPQRSPRQQHADSKDQLEQTDKDTTHQWTTFDKAIIKTRWL